MTIKEILLAGGTISFPYSEKDQYGVGIAIIRLNSCGINSDEVISVEIPTKEIKGKIEISVDKIDEAISLFEKLVFSNDNICNKR
jgi:hypothetical protein